MTAKSTKSKTNRKKTGTTSKKSTSNKKTTKKNTKKTTRSTRTAKSGNSFLMDEILIWITLAVSIILLISNFGVAGFLGDAVSGVLWEIFGAVAYIIPFVLFGLVSFQVSNKGNRYAYMKTVIAVLLLFLAEILLQLVDELGGKIGKGLASVLTPAIGVAGTYVVTVILMIICLVIITGKSALKGVKAGSDKAYARAKEDARRHKEHAEVRKRERMEQREQREKERAAAAADSGMHRRRDKHVEGVSFDTSIAKKSPEVRELPIDPKTAKGPEKPEFIIHRADPEPADYGKEDMTNEPEQKTPESENDPKTQEKPARRKNPKMGAAGMADEVADVAASVAADSVKPKKEYQYPPLSLLQRGKRGGGESDAHLRETAMKLQQTLENFGVKVTITNVSCGPSVTRYELQPEMGVKVSKIVGLADDIKLNLAVADIRIEAPIPGKPAVGIEIPNQKIEMVSLRDVLESPEMMREKSPTAVALGKGISGAPVIADMAKMPHVLIAGATGSGKSVCINTIINSIIFRAKPEEVRLILIDPKVVELSVYNGIPHLLVPVVTDPKKASAALSWAVVEMEHRYKRFETMGVRDIRGYNNAIGPNEEPMSKIIVIIDELADLMMVVGKDVEDSICRIAQKARAAGMHLIVATQRPSVDVITGLIKANIPSRIAFAVSSQVDSRTILDGAGAEKLLGMGDMLFMPVGAPKPTRIQGTFVRDEEISRVLDFIKKSATVQYDEAMIEAMEKHAIQDGKKGSSSADSDEEGGSDPMLKQAVEVVIDAGQASTSLLQRRCKLGYARAARIMDEMEEKGIIGPYEGAKPRAVLISRQQWLEMQMNQPDE